ncbi:MAG: HD domain-containing protein, partial [Campylobacterota bacterium]|nr:HD domain-containing protein [Campylobacterota bacterium]
EAVRRQEEARPVAMVFKYEHTHNFYRIYLEANLKRATREELEIIYQLLRTIEEDAYDLTSVASMHSADYEIRALKKSIGGGKVSSYEICGSVSLYDHTLRVARHMLELMEEDGSGVEKMEYAAGIIAAIAHDLGKMQAISSFSMAQSDKEMADHPHYKLSYTILQERFPEYEHLKKVLQAVENHHVAPTDASRITKLLVRADKSAREEETTEWYKKQKQLKEIEAVVIEIPTPKELEGGQSPTPVVDKPIEPKRDQKKPKTNSVVDKLGAFVEQAKDKADAEDASIPKEKKPEKPKQKKQSPADSNEKRKENKDKSKFSASFDFDFGAIEGDFKINLLKIMSEKVSSSVSAKQPDWVPMKSHVLIKYALMKEALAPFVTVTGEFPIDDYVKTLILKLVELGEADHINTDKGYYFSTFKYVERHGTSRFQVIPIKNTYFDISPQDAREMFRENGYRFEKFTIESYGGKEVF